MALSIPGVRDSFGPTANNQAAGGGIFDLPSPFPNDSWPPKKGGWSIGDASNSVGNMANWLFSQYSGLTPQIAGIFGDVLSGKGPDVARQLMAPVIANIQGQVPTMMRQAEDNLSGGALALAKMNAIQTPVSAIAQMLPQVYSNLIPAALDAQNVPMRTAQMLRDMAGVRLQADANKKSSGGGGLFK